MIKNLVFLFYLTSCLQIASAERSANGYFYDNPNALPSPIVDLPGVKPSTSLSPEEDSYYQHLRPPPQQQLNQPGYYFENGQQNPQSSHDINNFAQQQQQQQPFNQLALNFELPTQSQLNNVNYQPQQQFNPQAGNSRQIEFEIHDENQAFNSIEPSCGPEPIVGQFKPELVDLANGGPLTRMITTCGPNNDCKNIVLQSDLNRVMAVLSKQNNRQNNVPHGGYQEYHVQVEGRGNGGNFVQAVEPLLRPKNRRLIEYTEIPQDDLYN